MIERVRLRENLQRDREREIEVEIGEGESRDREEILTESSSFVEGEEDFRVDRETNKGNISYIHSCMTYIHSSAYIDENTTDFVNLEDFIDFFFLILLFVGQE